MAKFKLLYQLKTVIIEIYFKEYFYPDRQYKVLHHNFLQTAASKVEKKHTLHL